MTLLDLCNGVDGGTAGRQHGIQHDHIALGDVARQLAVIFYRFQRFGVTVQTNMTNARRGNQRQRPIHHAESGTQNGHKHQLATRQHLAGHGGDGGFDGGIGQRQITGGFVAQQSGDLRNQLAEFFGAGGFVAQARHLVLNQRMVSNKGIRHGKNLL